jgi:beta-lactamase class A
VGYNRVVSERQIKLKLKDEKAGGSGKLLVGLFLLTGAVSLGLWWRGKVIHGSNGGWQGLTGEMSFVISPTVTPVIVNSGSEQEKAVAGQLKELVATAEGKYAVYVYHPGQKTGYGFNQTEKMPAASIMKIPVLVAVEGLIESGQLSLDDQYTLEEADRTPGSGPLQYKQAGTKYSIGQLLTYLGKNSDNTAWVMFNRRLGEKTMEDAMKKMGLTDSSYGDLMTTAADVAKMFTYISGKDFFSGYLTDSIYEDRIPPGVPEGVTVIHKVGTDTGVWADAGIVQCSQLTADCSIEPFILVVLDKGVIREEAVKLVPEITKIVWDYENSLFH